MTANLAVILVALVVSLTSGAMLAPAASAAPAEQCFERTYKGKVSIDKKGPDDKTSYSATYTWCAKNGKVTKFIVTSTVPNPGTTAVYVDIRPFSPNAFGRPSFDIFINATRGKKSDYHAFRLTANGQSPAIDR